MKDYEYRQLCNERECWYAYQSMLGIEINEDCNEYFGKAYEEAYEEVFGDKLEWCGNDRGWYLDQVRYKCISSATSSGVTVKDYMVALWSCIKEIPSKNRGGEMWHIYQEVYDWYDYYSYEELLELVEDKKDKERQEEEDRWNRMSAKERQDYSELFGED